MARGHSSSCVERGPVGWSASGLRHGSGRKSSRQTGDPFWRQAAKDLLVDCVGRGREQRANNFQGFSLINEQTVVPLTDMGRAGGEAGFMGKIRVLFVRSQHAEAERGAGRAERKKGTQAGPARKRVISET